MNTSAPRWTETAVADALRPLRLLAHLDAQQIDRLARFTRVQTFDRGQAVVQRGDQRRSLFFLFEGRCQIIDAAADGAEVGIGFIEKGDYFGELTAIDGLARSATVIACSRVTVGELAPEQSLDLLHHNPDVSAQVLQRLAAKLRQASDLRVILSLANTHDRVCAMLARLPSRMLDGRSALVHNAPTQRELAIMVNTSRETVSRVLAQLQREDVISRVGRHLLIHDRQRLLASTAIRP